MKVKGGSSILDKGAVLDEYHLLNMEMGRLLDQAKHVNLTKVKVKSALGSIVTFQLGDAFLFLTAHAQRHVQQAMMVKNAI